MALSREKTHSPRSACLTGPDAGEKIQERSSKVQPKINRLKRPKKTAGTSKTVNKSINRDEICPQDTANGKNCLATAHTKSPMGPLKEISGHCLAHANDNWCWSIADSEPQIIDFCLDEEATKHVSMVTAGLVKEQRCCSDPSQALKTDIISTCMKDCDVQTLFSTVPETVIQRTFNSLNCPLRSVTASQNHRDMRSNFPDKTCEKLLEQIHAQNRHFPVHRFFSLLLKRGRQSEKGVISHGTCTVHTAPVFGKRKPEEFLHDDQPPKRSNKDSVCAHTSQCVNTQTPQNTTNPSAELHKPISRSRLSVSRRKKQQSTAIAWGQSVCSVGGSTSPECVTRDEDVLWTEKYQPRHSDEVIGNSASVRKLHSWLKEWRMRADVEERRKRQEEQRRMREESRESWDCGDFEGELVMVECEGELRNTVLIQGPVGVGKTAAVYACAEELGYKVFEVNSSSLRSRQIVLSQLREATQSHQVRELRPDSEKNKNAIKKDPVMPKAPPGAAASKGPKSATGGPVSSTGWHFPSSNILTDPGNDGYHQNHQTGTPGPDLGNQDEASRKLLGFSRKTSVKPRNTPRRKSSASPAITLKHFFKRTDRPGHKSTVFPRDPRGSDEASPDVLTDSDLNAQDSSNEQALKDPVLHRKDRTPRISLILFEEVDIIFSEDVGFLTAIKTLMTTTKRPIILTTSDPQFSGTFDGYFEELHFKTPPVEVTRSYLQCVCVVESVWPDPEDISFLLSECRGDVRRSMLELELWARSGRGNTHRHAQNKALTCRSSAELENSGCMDVVVENWRTGRGLFYSNLELLFTSFFPLSPQNEDNNTLKAACPTFERKLKKEASSSFALIEPRPGKLTRLKGMKQKSGDYKEMSCSKFLEINKFDKFPCSAKEMGLSESFSTEESSSKLLSCCLDTLAQFFDTMSFLDSCIYKQLLQVPGLCQPGQVDGWMGAKLTDSLVDILREEEVSPLLERSYVFLAVLEGLGFYQCRAELSETWRKAQKLKEVDGGNRSSTLMEHLISMSPDVPVCQKSTPSVSQNNRKVISKVLSSKAFRCHGNKQAVTMDYMPALRSMCRMERAKQQNKPRCLHYLNSIHLPLPKSVLTQLALDLH